MHGEIADFDNGLMTIAEMARRYDVSLRTLRFYEQCGLINPRRSGSHRLYSSKDTVRLQLIKTGKRLGFSLREIDDLLRLRAQDMPDEIFHLVDVLDTEKIETQLALLEKKRHDVCSAIDELKASIK